MNALRDRSAKAPGFVAAALLGVLAALVLAAGWALSADVPAGGAAGVPVGAVVDARHTTATADAYRRSAVSRWPHQLPAALAVVAVLVVIALGRPRSPLPRTASAPPADMAIGVGQPRAATSPSRLTADAAAPAAGGAVRGPPSVVS